MRTARPTFMFDMYCNRRVRANKTYRAVCMQKERDVYVKQTRGLSYRRYIRLKCAR